MRMAFPVACLLGAAAARAAPDARFLGGPHDGHALVQQITYARAGTAPWFSPRFQGGAYDGHAAQMLTVYDPDGTPPWFSDRFRGGAYDGFASAARRTYNADTAPYLHSLRFRGGARDGHDRILALGLPNPLAGDTDGDGLPDGWEVRFTNSLAFLHTGGDYDADGLNDEAERWADTHPLDAFSLFEILGLEPDEPVRITVTSTNTRIYTLEFTTNLLVGTGWTGVPGQADQPGSPTGTLTLEDTNVIAPRSMYRVVVEPP